MRRRQCQYLARDWLWYFPPPEIMARLVKYANRHGGRIGRPYYSLDGEAPVTAEERGRLRHPWKHRHGPTNVWAHPPLHGEERRRGNGRRSAPGIHNPGRNAAAHLNQKPLAFMRRIIEAVTDEGAVVWEPFGGLCSASVAAIELGRKPFAAEPDAEFARLARLRLNEAAAGG